jgi:GT2 family glycosyltransferase
MKLSVIIVNYNVKYFLEQALLSVRKASANLEVEVFVVDNNSVDESVQMVREKFPEVQLIVNKHNPGFSIANNQAIRQSKGEYVLLLNPDTVVEEDTFEKCIEFMDAHPKAGGLGVRMIDGSGKFLPESKRGFPAPFVAFAKTFGLSRIFPRSKTFNHYHLGYLSEHENHEVEVLAGAFMLLRKSVLDEIGLLDEAFFMYGEDIDLSYRIIKAGYKNYYLSDTSIIHYKGESTKKGSLNYVRTFYNAMIIFARKHFEGDQARFFVLMLQGAIYFRALLTLLSNWYKKAYLPFLDALLIFIGLYFLKNFWATYYFNDPNYYDQSFLWFNAPLYILIWLTSVYFSGGYDEKGNIRRLGWGLLSGTVLLAAVYGFLDLEYRSSRALIILGSIWALLSTISLRFIIHFLRYRNFNVGRDRTKNLVIIGTQQESRRVQQLIQKAQVQKNIIGTVAPGENPDAHIYLSSLDQLAEVVHIYKIDEIIFCSKDISTQDIMSWMTKLGPALEYRIVPEESLSIIGSSSKNTAGELYTIEIRFQIAHYMNRRNKRMLDILWALLLLLTFPIHLMLMGFRFKLFSNIFKVLAGKKSWVGYAKAGDEDQSLPEIRPGVLSPLDALEVKDLNEPTIQRLNFIYAKDYLLSTDLDIILRGYFDLAR